jgi:aspartate kinase
LQKTHGDENTVDMALIVQKYGGSSVADIPKLRVVAEHVARTQQAGHQVVVVVSAMGKTTQQLMQQALSITHHPSARELDMLVSTGERISMALLAMALHSIGINAVSFTGSQSGIVTTSEHQHARILHIRPHRILEALAQNQVVIVAGYQGVSEAHEVTTLGRGGSDTTAVALASFLKADACEIYSDVAGVYSADPHVVPQAHRIPLMGYRTMLTMAQWGAKVLNADAVAYAEKTHTVIYARATGKPVEEQTVVSSHHMNQGVVAVCSHPHVLCVQHSEAMVQLLVEQKAQVLHHTHTDTWYLNIENMVLSTDETERLAAQHKANIRRVDCVSAVGEHFESEKTWSLLKNFLHEQNVEVLDHWTGDCHLSCVVLREQSTHALNLLHQFFF